jgi:Mg/Co/Ni transporter MgtE
MLGQLVRIELIDLDEETSRRRLLERVRNRRGKPEVRPVTD